MTLESAMAATVARVRNGAAFMQSEGSSWLNTPTHINILLTTLPVINWRDRHLGVAILAAGGTREGNERAVDDSWAKALNFLRAALIRLSCYESW